MAERVRPLPTTAVVVGGTESDPIHYLARMPGGRIHVLTGSAAQIWQAVSDLGDIGSVIAEVAASYAVSEAEVGPTVRAFVDELTELGLLGPGTDGA